MKKIHFIILTAAVFSAQALEAQNSPVHLDKVVSPKQQDGSYNLTLTSYLTGKLYDNSSAGATDIAILWDGSKKLNTAVTTDQVFTEVSKPITVSVKSATKTDPTITGTTKEKATVATPTVNPTVKTKAMSATNRTSSSTKNWTYSNVTANAAGTADYSHFYKDANGDYYAVHKAKNLTNSSSGSANVRALWYVDKNGTTWYLTSDGVSSTYKDVTSDSGTIWNGTLFKGWTYKTYSNDSGTQCYGLDGGNADATDAAQFYYLHTDGEYYPVRRAANLSDGNGNNDVYAAWVVIDGITWYLHGDKLDTTYDKTMKSQYRAIWFGAPLYKGGWTYSSIVAANEATNSKTGHYYLYDNKYYPVQKEDLGAEAGNSRYQAFIEVPSVGKLYLYGTNHLSTTPCPFTKITTVPMFFGPLTVGGWTYNNTNYDSAQNYYQWDVDGEYYPVRKETSTNNFQLYVDLPIGKRYFDGNGLSETSYAFSTTKYVTVYFGTFYTMTGWSQALVTDATAGGGHYYKHTDDNRYYPVLKETHTNPQTGTVTYQLYVEIQNGANPEQTVKRYLWGHSVHPDPCPYSATTALIIWYGTLYKGGWSQSTITVGGGGYSYLHTDNQYYLIYRKTVNLDANRNIVTSGGTATYQDCVKINGVEYYLYGNAISEAPYPYSVKKNSNGVGTVNNWFGPLYSGGWTCKNITPLGTAENGLHYKQGGNYYPIESGTETIDGTKTYQAWVTINGQKWYLSGKGLSTTAVSLSTANTVSLYFGTLYYGGWTYNGITAGTASGGQFYLHDGKYYGLEKPTAAINGAYQVKIGKTLENEEMPGGPWYLAGSGISTTPYTYSTAKTTSLYFPTLYQLKNYNKDVGLSNAVNAFIEEVGEMSMQKGLEHRITLLQFGKNQWVYNNGTNVLKPDLNEKHNASVAEVFAHISKVNTESLVSDVTTKMKAVQDLNTSKVDTYHSYGLALARAVFRREGGVDEGDSAGYNYGNTNMVSDFEQSFYTDKSKLTDAQKTEYANRPKVVIIIGDGLNDKNETQARAWAALLKNYSWGSMTDDAASLSSLPEPLSNVKIYYVQIGASTPSQFVQDISSGSNYCKTSALYDEELEEKLIEIAREIGGDVVNVGGSTVVQDVVAPEFEIPAGSSVQMFTSRWHTHENENTPRFDDEADWETFNGAVQQTSNQDGTTTIKVSGFDFDANWCGDHGAGVGQDGKQLIVRIKIAPKEGVTVGGTLPTNTDDSKLLDGDENTLGVYPIPTISGIPIHIQISKSGLRQDDSAIFTVRRKLRSDANYETTPYMKVILKGNAAGTAVTADLWNLDPDYHYIVEEEGWSWTYTPTVVSISTEQQTLNPFQFGNTPRTDITYDYGEREVKNIF